MQFWKAVADKIRIYKLKALYITESYKCDSTWADFYTKLLFLSHLFKVDSNNFFSQTPEFSNQLKWLQNVIILWVYSQITNLSIIYETSNVHKSFGFSNRNTFRSDFFFDQIFRPFLVETHFKFFSFCTNTGKIQEIVCIRLTHPIFRVLIF